MDVAGVAFRQSVCFSSNSCRSESFPVMKKPGSVCFKKQPNRRSVVFKVSSDMFSDKSHLEYYNNNNGPRMAVKEKEDVGSKKKEMKKKLKLLKGLSKNLNYFSDMGFGLNPDTGGLDHQVKGQIISEATEVLLGQLQKLKEEKMESKRIKKEEKAKKKAARMMTECKDSSSSSSSESDCDNVMNMKQLKTVATSNLKQQVTSSSLALVTPLQIQQVENRVIQNPIGKDIVSNVDVDVNSKKIEVCMGGKCKKSGAAMLLENFQAAVGGEAAVVGCKCMGKCKDGPNVRVRSEEGDAVSNPLCIGVELEDVESIVTNFFSGSRESCSEMVPALSAGV